MDKVRSTDGTVIAYERFGDEAPVVLVGGAFNDRRSPAAGIPLAEALRPGHSVVVYDRRGRGDSGDTAPYAVEREVEDLRTVVEAVGGEAALFGHSSGAALVLRAAAAGVPATRLALFEPPFTAPPTDDTGARDLAAEIDRLVSAGRRGEAVELFQVAIGIPAEVVEQLRGAPFRPALEAIAHTLPYDLAVLGSGAVPVGVLAQLRVPTLVVVGAESPEPLVAAGRAVAGGIDGATLAVIEGHDHGAGPDELARAVDGFLAEG